MTKYPNPYYVIGTIFILIGVAVYTVFSIKETAVLPVVLGCSIIYKGVSIREKMGTEDSTRDRIMGTSFILPGLVQICDMKKKTTGVAMISVYVFCYLILISIAFSFFTIDSVGEKMMGIILVFSLIILFTDILLCLIQSNEFCNQKKLPYIQGEFEGNWTNTPLAYGLTLLVMSAISVIMTFLILCLL